MADKYDQAYDDWRRMQEKRESMEAEREGFQGDLEGLKMRRELMEKYGFVWGEVKELVEIFRERRSTEADQGFIRHR